MTLQSKKEYLLAMRERYRSSKRRDEKSQIISEVEKVLKDHRKHAIRTLRKKSLVRAIKRDRKYGGDIIFRNYHELENSFESGKLHAFDLKNAVAESLNEIIEPIRKKWK